MAGVRFGYALVLILLLAGTAAIAADQPLTATPGLYDRPVLVVDPGMHTARISSADTDAAGRWAVTASYDKTVRVWSLADGTWQRTIRLPAGPGPIGRLFAVAMSPDGALIAAGGWTRSPSADDAQEQIYLFDRASGAVVHRIDGLRQNVLELAFSLDGRRLAAVLGSMSDGGLRIYAREQNWAEVARDMDYADRGRGAVFARDGRLATSSSDGKVRLYTGDFQGHIHPTVAVAPAGSDLGAIAFSPDGNRLAIGHASSAAVTLVDGRELTPLPGPDLSGIDNGSLERVAWSRDGQTLFAGGRYTPTKGRDPPVLSWGNAGAGARRALKAGQNTISSLVSLPEGDLLVAAADPWFGRLQADGSSRWTHGAPQVHLGDQSDKLAVSSDGTLIDFYFDPSANVAARFDLTALSLTPNPPADQKTTRPRRNVRELAHTPPQEVEELATWLEKSADRLRFAIHPNGNRLVLGWPDSLQAVDLKRRLWSRAVPEEVWAVNITSDGRLLIVAYHDGTIRWHRMTDGVELLAFMPLADQTNWVAWTPEGFYAATAGAHGILRWHVNHSWDAPAESVPIEDIPGSFRPAVLPLVLQELETPRALGLAMLAEHNREIMIRTHSGPPPGMKLHLLTVGISAYNDEYAKRLRLTYADSDARDLASAVVNTQESLYAAGVKPQVLQNQDATKDGILRALKTMRAGMAAGGGNDLAVVHFSGHGALVDGKLYLLPYEVDARDAVGIQSKGLSINEFRGELLELAQHGRVLVLLDACHSGATTMDGAALTMDSTALRTGLAAANVTVLTSSSGGELSREDAAWQHGAFTKALLDAFNDPAADPDHNGLISTNVLAHYLAQHVASLTGGAQTPGMEVRYDSTVFAAGLLNPTGSSAR